MRVLVTGASGFLGRAIVDAVTRAGHSPIALVRPVTDVADLDWSGNVRIVRGDLRQPAHVEEIGVVDAVIHAAAGTSGNLADQVASSVVSTENLFGLLDTQALKRFVHVSSFSVYDFHAQTKGSLISVASSRLESEPEDRDAYTSAKIAQELLVRQLTRDQQIELVVARPGVIFGPGKTWAWGSAGRIGPFDLVPSPRATFRLIHVDNCADALVAAVTAPLAAGEIVDLVDDDLPTHLHYHRRARLAGANTGIAVPIPWSVMRLSARLVHVVARRVAGREPKLPEIASVRKQEARWKPFRYDNHKAKDRLDWQPNLGMQDAIVATVAAQREFESA